VRLGAGVAIAARLEVTENGCACGCGSGSTRGRQFYLLGAHTAVGSSCTEREREREKFGEGKDVEGQESM